MTIPPPIPEDVSEREAATEPASAAIESAGWVPVDAATGLWSMAFPVGAWEGRASALALPGGGFLVFNPGPRQERRASSVLQKKGGVAALVVANHFHHLGLRRWRAFVPEAAVVASANALPRLASQGHSGLVSLAAVEALLPSSARFLCPAGTRSGEVWLRVKTERGVAWLVGDAFFNVDRSPPGFFGLVARLTGTTPGLCFGRGFKYLQVADRLDYQEWVLAQLSQDSPRILVPAHGDVLECDDLALQLRERVEARLG